jgi:formyltetrahydrofolate deformylase
MKNSNETGRILISCPDRPGIVAAVSRFLYEQGANIVYSDQHSTDPTGGVFFMRVEFQLIGLEEKEAELNAGFSPLAAEFKMQWKMSLAARIKRLAIFVSKQEHALLELLWRKRAGDLTAKIVMVISNHPDLEPIAVSEGIPFHHIPVDPTRKREAEEQQIALMKDKVDIVALARYMQIVTPYFIAQYPFRIINIHHSFLPAFAGGNPYAQANARGVKLIGATAHYVTAELDAGPIIEQDVERVSHRYGVDDLKQIGQHIERRVLARAVIWDVEDRILVYGNKTIVFA